MIACAANRALAEDDAHGLLTSRRGLPPERRLYWDVMQTFWERAGTEEVTRQHTTKNRLDLFPLDVVRSSHPYVSHWRYEHVH